MDFLPLEKNGKEVYVGFWKRFLAMFIDGLIMMPFVYIFYLIESVNIFAAMLVVFLSTSFFYGYTIFFNYKYGGTIGKLVVNIRITRPNGSTIGMRESFLRSSVDLIFAVFFVIGQVVALSIVDSEQYTNASFVDRGTLMTTLFPVWYVYVIYSSNIWCFGERLFLLFNKRKRALHDFIAGTVVIHKEYSKQDTN